MASGVRIYWHKFTHWEYWPWYIVYIPIYFYWLWCSLKAGAIFWFSAANPGFEYGGIIGNSKQDILDRLPQNYIPKTLSIHARQNLKEVELILQENDICYPLIIKPNIGERGFHVALINNRQELSNYLDKLREDHIIQEYLDLPLELGVFYVHEPQEPVGRVTSVVKKKMLVVTGDGFSSVGQLMRKDFRAMQQMARLKAEGKVDLDKVLPKDEPLLLEPIGNHVLGTTFLDACELINDQLNNVFNDLALQIDGFYYGP